MITALKRQVMVRAGGRCEAEVEHGVQTSLWARCTNPASDVHHMLTKARGGENLDRVWETYHLIALCRDCHDRCMGMTAYEGGLLIDGSVIWDKHRQVPVYNGSDEYLTERYGVPLDDFDMVARAQRLTVE